MHESKLLINYIQQAKAYKLFTMRIIYVDLCVWSSSPSLYDEIILKGRGQEERLMVVLNVSAYGRTCLLMLRYAEGPRILWEHCSLRDLHTVMLCTTYIKS